MKRVNSTWRNARLWLVFALGILGAIFALSAPITPQQSGFALAVGDVSPQDILAPYELAYTSEVMTAAARESAAEAIAPIYDPPDGKVARQQVELLRQTLAFIDTVRADSLASAEQKDSDLAALQNVRLDEPTRTAILSLSDTRWQVVKLESVSVLEEVMRNEIREDRIGEARRSIPALVSISLPEDQANLVVHLASAFVAPNSLFNSEATLASQEQARASIVPVVKSFAAGETIVSRGQVVSDLQIEALQAFGLLDAPNPWRAIAVRSLLIVLLSATIALYAFRVHLEKMTDMRIAVTICVLIVLATLGLQIMIPGRTIMPYLFPAAAVPLIVSLLTGPGLGVLSAMLLGSLAGYLAPRGLEMALYVTFSGAMGALMIGKADRLSSFFWAGLASSLAAVAIVVVFRFPDPSTDLLGKATLLAVGMVNGVLAASIGVGLLLLIGTLLGLTTSLQLIELSRPDHPLQQYILRNAPGTYQHSLQVANLAEQAARVVGANALLTRVGALYHDAGKAARAQFFIENQVPGQNVHEQLDPTTSAGVILDHVNAGLELARRYRLPERVQAFIPEHHGTMHTSYQYRAALDAAGGNEELVDSRQFQYPGPTPQSKETAILMLADGVEAKARAEAPDTEDDIDKLVRWVINSRLEQGQLDHVDLTLRDLDAIRRSFISTLRGIYHPRIIYPAADEEVKTPPPEEDQTSPNIEDAHRKQGNEKQG